MFGGLPKKLVNTEEYPTVPFDKCPAKTEFNSEGKKISGWSVVDHCTIVGEVCRELLSRMPRITRELFPQSAPLIAAAHDIGKVSPYFYQKIKRNCEVWNGFEADMGISDPSLEKSWGGHAAVTQVALTAMNVPSRIPELLGQHHGFSPNVSTLTATQARLGGEGWQNERRKLIAELMQRLGCEWDEIEDDVQARIMAGLTTTADWIGSGDRFAVANEDYSSRIKLALDGAGFLPFRVKEGLTFEDIFNFQPRDAQIKFYENVISPGVYVLEAPMGYGKTEAALHAAYQVLVREQASGVYFALPTQLTSNKIFERFNKFLQRILLESEDTTETLLLHSGAWLVDTNMGEEGSPGGAWFSQSKRGLLAPFAVGTIDQALMAAMNVKHGFVRAFGLAGKVVILDEIHSYDAYTSVLVKAMVDLLLRINCTVIILSATLTKTHRQKLTSRDVESEAYPLITSAGTKLPLKEVAIAVTNSQAVNLKITSDENWTLNEVLDRSFSGQQIVWLENTVQEAQDCFLNLAARARECGVECGLIHSRFTPEDRERNEDFWVNCFGKQGWPKRQERGRILVGTQVLEQSIDIDADFMVTRFAPSDMLLQRLGRLWRHSDTPRIKGSRCEAILLAPDLEAAIEDPHKQFGKTAYVYAPYVLCRSLEQWQNLSEVKLPGDIRSILEATYADRCESPAMEKWRHELIEGNSRRLGQRGLESLANLSLSQGVKTLPEVKAQTRYSEIDNLELLLIKEFSLNNNESQVVLTILNGEKVTIPLRPTEFSKRQLRQVAVKLHRQVVKIASHDEVAKIDQPFLRKIGLHNCFYLGDPQLGEATLQVALVDERGGLKAVNGWEASSAYTYSRDLGFRKVSK